MSKWFAVGITIGSVIGMAVNNLSAGIAAGLGITIVLSGASLVVEALRDKGQRLHRGTGTKTPVSH